MAYVTARLLAYMQTLILYRPEQIGTGGNGEEIVAIGRSTVISGALAGG